MSTAASTPLDIPLGNAVNYHLAYSAAGALSLSIRALGTLSEAHCDYRIVSQYDPTNAVLATYFDARQGNNVQVTPTSAAIDATIYSDTRETHNTWIRVQNPNDATLWSTYEVNMFSSGNGARVIVWVVVIDENGSY